MTDIVGGGMSDNTPVPNIDLRTRIAAAACGATSFGKSFPWDTLSEAEKESWRSVADAVIREIGLQHESEYIDFDDGHAGGYPHEHHRYVTDWKS